MGLISRLRGSWISRWRRVAMVPYLSPNKISRGARTAATARTRHRERIHSWARSDLARPKRTAPDFLADIYNPAGSGRRVETVCSGPGFSTRKP